MLFKFKYRVQINNADKGEVEVIEETENKAYKKALKLVKASFNAEKDDIDLSIISIKEQ
jgi:hypothetical protein